MEGSGDSNKRKGDDVQDGTGRGKKLQKLIMGIEFFDYSICSNTLRPPIYQLSIEYHTTFVVELVLKRFLISG